MKQEKTECYEISAYKGELTPVCLAKSVVKIKKAFPILPKEFFDILSDRLVANNFTDSRLEDAVTHVIDNCIYPSPTIAQFISFDKRINIYTHDQVLKMNQELSYKAFQFYRPVRIKESQKIPFYAHVDDIEYYKLKIWKND